MTPGNLVFVDTNVLVYFRDEGDARKQSIASDWIQRLQATRRGRISTQVLIEFHAVITRGHQADSCVEAARADVEAFAAWQPIQPDVDLLRRAWSVADRYSVSWWDAMVIAAALVARCSTLLSEDMQHGLVIDQTLTIVNPFATDPAA